MTNMSEQRIKENQKLNKCSISGIRLNIHWTDETINFYFYLKEILFFSIEFDLMHKQIKKFKKFPKKHLHTTQNILFNNKQFQFILIGINFK